MYLIINTARNNEISLSLKDGDIFVDEITVESFYTQAETLLPLIDELLTKHDKKIGDVKKIGVVNQGDGFTSLRIGVITANALGFALGVPVFPVGGAMGEVGEAGIVRPIYSREPNIT